MTTLKPQDTDEGSVHRIIDRMKAAVGAKTDNDLAKYLNISKVTISSWRRRNQIPYEYCSKISDETHLPLEYFIKGRRATDHLFEEITEDAANTYLFLLCFSAFNKYKSSINVGDDHETMLWWCRRFGGLYRYYEDRLRHLTRPGGMNNEAASQKLLADLNDMNIGEFLDMVGQIKPDVNRTGRFGLKQGTPNPDETGS